MVLPAAFGPSTPNSGGRGSGVQKTGNNGSFGAAFVPQGAQTALLQDAATISQTVAGMSAGTYAISVLSAKRGVGRRRSADVQYHRRRHGRRNVLALVDGILYVHDEPVHASRR